MPRFMPDKWKPVDDSSEGYRTLDPESVVLAVRLGEGGKMSCPCGCELFPSGKKTVFMMGHDARLRGVLIRAYLTGVKIRYYVDGELGEPADPYDVAGVYWWKSYLDDAVARREASNREVLRRALEAGEQCLKYARWSPTGGQVIAIYEGAKPGLHRIEWVDRAGTIKITRVREDESPLADIVAGGE